MRLTDVKVRNAKPKGKQYKLFDGDGLFFQVMPNGSKYWRYKYRFADKEKTLALGVLNPTENDREIPLKMTGKSNSI